MINPDRNDPCPCGSGKKYKRCCLPREEARQRLDRERKAQMLAESRPDLDVAVDRVLRRLEQGEGERVKQAIEKLLQQHPDYHMTQYAMGVYQATVAKNPKAAISHLERAVAILPPFAEAHFNLGMAAQQTFDIVRAAEAYRAAKECAADDHIAHLAAEQLQWLEGVVTRTSPFLTLEAYLANAQLFHRAFACLSRAEYPQAVELLERVLTEYPGHVASHGNLALAYLGLGRRADALACLDRALELDPDYEPAKRNREVALRTREGEPLTPEFFMEVEFYADRLRAEQRSGESGKADA